ncbi:hypothetical protein [Hymenobacter cellulosilyticus]|uniref:hypothetical protein n=1 Tax=Hymenobacter cellulosilyticus TaxID=2932248 RepID=UPI002880415A|nr:hypothetical protein [Hymenobacter cellulosilyticus]
MLLEGALNVRVVLFPDGDDPDSYIRKVGDQRFKEYLDKNSQDFISFKTRLVSQEAAHDPVKKAEAIREVLQSIAKVPDPIKRQVFLQQTSTTFAIDEQVLITEYNKLVKKDSQRAAPAAGRAAKEIKAAVGAGPAAGPSRVAAHIQPRQAITNSRPPAGPQPRGRGRNGHVRRHAR